MYRGSRNVGSYPVIMVMVVVSIEIEIAEVI
jgi:hypothetical protein